MSEAKERFLYQSELVHASEMILDDKIITLNLSRPLGKERIDYFVTGSVGGVLDGNTQLINGIVLVLHSARTKNSLKIKLVGGWESGPQR